MNLRQLWLNQSLTLAGEVDSPMIDQLDAWLKAQLHAAKAPRATTIFITSNGGASEMGTGLYERLRIFHRPLNIHLLAIGGIGSAALYASMAVPRARRFLTANTSVFLHQVQQGYTIPYQGSLSSREHNIAEVVTSLKHQHCFQAWMIGLFAKEMRRSPAAVAKMIHTERYLTAAQAVRMGLFQAVLHPGR